MSKRSIDFSLCRLLASNVQRAFDVVLRDRAFFYSQVQKPIYISHFDSSCNVLSFFSHHFQMLICRWFWCYWSNASRVCSHFRFIFGVWKCSIPFHLLFQKPIYKIFLVDNFISLRLKVDKLIRLESYTREQSNSKYVEKNARIIGLVNSLNFVRF